MTTRPFSVAATILLCVTGCANVEVAPPPRQGPILAAGGGVSGYQHGAEGTKFAVGQSSRRSLQYGYVKQTGDEGTLAIRQSNGSVFGVPNARSASLKSPPYGNSPQDHERYVRDYFVRLGLPADQVQAVRTMTLLEASGRTDEATRAIPRVTAYYSVLNRSVGDVIVPDSFAWARVNSEGVVVQEGVYWPALPSNVVADATKLKGLLADPAQRRAFESRTSMDATAATVAVRHASASEDRFNAFASIDITVRVSASGQRGTDASSGGAAVVRHFDIDGVERFLPQESLNLADKYPARKDVSR